jgi:hypothetical protein
MRTMIFTMACVGMMAGYTGLKLQAYAMDRADSPTKTLRIVSANVNAEKAITFSAAFGGVK